MRTLPTRQLVPSAERIDQSHHWLFPETYEIFFGGAASLMIFGLLWWKAWPLVKKGMASRTQRVQDELDAAAADRASADAEATEIRRAKGDIAAEQARLLADADAQAESLLTDGRGRLDEEIADLHAKSEADVAAAIGRGSDELRAEIARLASAAADAMVADGVDDATHQALIESFIQRVGAEVPA